MQNTDFERFHALLVGMGELFGKEISTPLLDAYWVALRDWDLPDFEQACAHLMGVSKFMPRPADFNDLRRATEETAGEVFAQVRQWIKYTPNGYTVAEGTPRPIASAIRAMGGADAYAMCDIDKLPFLERRFCEHYEQISKADEAREAVPQLGFAAKKLSLSGLKLLSKV